MYRFCGFIALASGLLLTPIQTQEVPPSPCPGVFQYEASPWEPGRWYGKITLPSDRLRSTTTVNIILDKKVNILGNWVGDISSRDNTNFALKISKLTTNSDRPLDVRFYVQYDMMTSPAPMLKRIQLDGADICNADDPASEIDSRFQTAASIPSNNIWLNFVGNISISAINPMTERKAWSKDETTHLIEKYEQHKELWDTKDVDYNNNIKKNSTLHSLADEFNTTAIEIVKKMNDLNTQYAKEDVKVQNSKNNEGYSYASEWEYYQMLNFTRGHHPAFIGDSVDYTETTNLDVNKNNPPELRLSLKCPMAATLGTNQIEYAVNHLTIKPGDEFQIFGDYVASEIRNMQSARRVELKQKILLLLLEFTEINENANSGPEIDVRYNEN